MISLRIVLISWGISQSMNGESRSQLSNWIHLWFNYSEKLHINQSHRAPVLGAQDSLGFVPPLDREVDGLTVSRVMAIGPKQSK